MSDKDKKIPSSSPEQTYKKEHGSREIQNTEELRNSRKPTMQKPPPRTERTTSNKDS